MGLALPVLNSTPPLPQVERASPRSVRISVTDRCDMACVYCRPSVRDGYLPVEDRLDVDQWEALVRGLLREGVRRVRITGGEPLLFRGLLEVVRRIHALGVDDLALTTNASRLARLAVPLREAGLQRLNISIDTLQPARFERITRGGDLAEVLRGIDAACEAGYTELKTNTVVLRGENDDELAVLTRWAWERGITPRFIEVMGIGEGGKIWREKLVPVAEMRLRLAHLLETNTNIASGIASGIGAGVGAGPHAHVDPGPDVDRGPARYFRARDGSGRRVGFISGSSDTFCAGCDRLRATSDGVLRACLSRNDGVSVAEILHQDGASMEAQGALLAEGLHAAWAMKPDETWKGCTEETARQVSMVATGG